MKESTLRFSVASSSSLSFPARSLISPPSLASTVRAATPSTSIRGIEQQEWWYFGRWTPRRCFHSLRARYRRDAEASSPSPLGCVRSWSRSCCLPNEQMWAYGAHRPAPSAQSMVRSPSGPLNLKLMPLQSKPYLISVFIEGWLSVEHVRAVGSEE